MKKNETAMLDRLLAHRQAQGGACVKKHPVDRQQCDYPACGCSRPQDSRSDRR